MSNEVNKEDAIKGTRRQALFLWVGMGLALTLFFVQSQVVFVNRAPLPSSSFEWVFVFIGIATFLLGYFFFDNYMRVRKKRMETMTPSQKKQVVLMAFVFQFVLFETLGMYGVLLSVFMQSTAKAVPFILFSYIGFCLAFPKQKKIEQFF